MATILLIIGVLIGPILFLPWRAMWHWASGLSVLLVALWLFSPRSPAADVSLDDTFAILFYQFIIGLSVIAVIIRLVIRSAQIGSGAMDLTPFAMPRTTVFLMGLGVAARFIALLAGSLAGSTMAVPAHLFLIGLGLSIGYLWRVTLARAFAVGLIGLTAYSSAYPLIVQSAARAAANDTPFCIYLNQSRRFATPSDMTFLTFDKGTWTAHAILIIGTGDDTSYGNWSYRQRQFMVPWDLHTPPPALQCPANH